MSVNFLPGEEKFILRARCLRSQDVKAYKQVTKLQSEVDLVEDLLNTGITGRDIKAQQKIDGFKSRKAAARMVIINHIA
ncbi:MAG: hypothetical protein WAV41_05590 [Microgenomates group bacterium]